MSLDTRGYQPQRLLPQSLEDRLVGLLGRAGGLSLLTLVCLLWLCLVTWSVTDPSLTHATANAPTNALGRLGAVFSDLLLQTLGFAAAVGLIAPLAWSIELVRSERVTAGRLKLGFFPIAVLATAGALSSLPLAESWPLNHGYGGLLGDGVFSLTTRLFAILNEGRAELAAGLVLIAAAISMCGKTIGFDADELFSMAGNSWRSLRQSRLWSKAQPAAATAAVHPAAQSEMQPGEANGWPHQLPDYAPQVPAHAPYGYGGVPMPPRDNAYVVHPEDRVGLEHPATAAFDSQLPPQHRAAGESGSSFQAVQFGGDTGDLVDRGFDASKIARRFAPRFNGDAQPSDHDVDVHPSGEMDAPVAAVGPAAVPAKPPRAFKGFAFSGSSDDVWKGLSINLLSRPAPGRQGAEHSQAAMRGNARLLEDVLADFGVKGEVKDIRPGPVVTLYELEPSRGTKSSRVINLADDIARSMSVSSIRAAVVANRNAIGLELPNGRREPVMLREILESDAYKASEAVLPMALGKTIGGDPVVADLARMPHLLVAGTTGSGKSVGINAFILSLLYRHSPDACRMIMIDPKMLELSVYNGIPHLLTPVVTDPQKAVAALNWAVLEMEERYKRMAALNVRGIEMYNNRVRNAKTRGERLGRTVQTGFDKSGQAKFETQKIDAEPLPHIVIVVDEFADLMIAAGKEVETAVQRLAQMARAAGIHLVMATQRPSVDVITGTIKANFPTRISFKVASKVDSRTILNEQGAEQLLGQGDMLYSTGAGQVMRVHGAFVSDEEVEAVTDALRRQGSPNYVDGILDVPERAETPAGGGRETSEGDLYDRAVAIVMRDQKASISYVQRRLQIGYNRAADLIERMEREGLISPANGVGRREIHSGSAAVHDYNDAP